MSRCCHLKQFNHITFWVQQRAGIPRCCAISVILHAHVPDNRRSTILSVQSLLKQLGAMAGLLVLGWIGETEGVGTAWIAGTVGLGAAAALAILLAGQARN